MQSLKTKLNLGAGELIERGDEWLNLDLLDLPGIDIVHNLVFLPYPFEGEQFEYVQALDVLEHLPSYTPDWKPMIVAFIEEMHRILKPGGTLYIQTPGYNAEFLYIDITHVRGFHPESMDFFDPDKPFGQTTGFYSKAKFRVSVEQLENKNLRFTMVKR